MSIEKNLDTIATSLASIAMSLEKLVYIQSESVTRTVQDKPAKKEVQATPAPVVVAPVVEAPAPVVPTVAVPAPVEAPATPTVVVPSGSAPFTDAKGLMNWIMEKYKALGPVKGALIQNVLQEMGCASVNAVKPEQYGAFFSKVEAIK